MITPYAVREMLESIFWKQGHAVLASGKHSPQGKLDLEPLLESSHRFLEEVCRWIWSLRPEECTVVVGPPRGGDLLARKMSELLPRAEITYIQTQKNPDGTFAVLNPKDAQGRGILLLDDVLTTGSSFLKLRETLLGAGIQREQIQGAAVVYNRGNVQKEDIGLGVLYQMVKRYAPAYAPEDCPICHPERERSVNGAVHQDGS